jgi:hypothetical protein
MVKLNSKNGKKSSFYEEKKFGIGLTLGKSFGIGK